MDILALYQSKWPEFWKSNKIIQLLYQNTHVLCGYISQQKEAVF